MILPHTSLMIIGRDSLVGLCFYKRFKRRYFRQLSGCCYNDNNHKHYYNTNHKEDQGFLSPSQGHGKREARHSAAAVGSSYLRLRTNAVETSSGCF